jgi:hypothetical protein
MCTFPDVKLVYENVMPSFHNSILNKSANERISLNEVSEEKDRG